VAETDYNPGRLDLGGLNLKLNGKEAIVPDLLWVNANNDAERQLATPGDEVGRWRFETGAMVAKRTFGFDDYAELCGYFGAANRREVHWSAATVSFPLTIASTRDFVPYITPLGLEYRLACDV
jgi:hypothetical protein